jgi:hypothetical protein
VFTFPGEEQLRVRHNPAVGIVLLVIGGGFSLYGLWHSLLDGFDSVLVPAALLMLLGMLYLVRPYFRVTPTSVDVMSLIGPGPLRQFPYKTLKVRDNKLVAVQDDGTGRKVAVLRWFAHSGDWHKLTSSLQE